MCRRPRGAGSVTSLGGRWSWPALVAALSLGTGLVSGWHLLQQLGLALLALLALSWLATVLGALGISAHGQTDARTAVAGEWVTVRYELRNRGIWPVSWILLEPQGLSIHPVQGQFVALGPRARRTVEIALNCPQRGEWEVGGWTMRTGDPFGFFERVRAMQGTGTVIVFPRPLPLQGLSLPILLGQASGARGPGGVQQAATVRDVRPYRAGDLPSRIHWLSTVRLDTLMVREPESDPSAHLWLVLDLREDIQYGSDETDSAELVVGAACAVLQRLDAQGLAIGMLIAGESTVLIPNSRRGQRERILATLSAAATGPDTPQQGLARLRESTPPQLQPHRSGVIAITPWADRALAAVLSEIVRPDGTALCILVAASGTRHDADLDLQETHLRAIGVRTSRQRGWAA